MGLKRGDVRLKKSYSSREVAALTGLTARQLQGWDAGRLVQGSIAPVRTAAGGFTERRYSPIELFELLVLADLRRRGFSVHRLRQLVANLRARFGVRLFDAIEGGPLKLFTDGHDVYALTASGELHSLLQTPDQPLLMLRNEGPLRELGVRIRSRKRPAPQAGRRKSAPAPAAPPESPESALPADTAEPTAPAVDAGMPDGGGAGADSSSADQFGPTEPDETP